MIRVLHLITGLGGGGAEGMLARLVTSGRAGDIRHSVVSLMGPGVHGDFLRARRVPLETLDLGQGSIRASALLKLAGILRHHRPDVLQTWLYHADLMGLLAAGLAGVPHLLWNVRCSDMDTRHYSPLTELVRSALVGASHVPDGIVVNSRAGQEFHQALGYRARAWHLLPNGVDTARFRPDPGAPASVRHELGLSSRARLVGVVARFDPMKNHLGFVRAFAQVARAHPEAHALLIGRGNDRSNEALQDEVAKHGLQARVLLLGERRDIPRLMAAMDVSVLPSLFGEGFPNVVAESMACGIPCAVSDVGDAARIVGSTGAVATAGDMEALSRTVCALLELSADERARRGEACRARILEQYALAHVVESYESLYRQTAA